MTNLKKVLSLALAFAMVLGIMISASAAVDVSDWDDIDNKDAVELLAALGIMRGRADGTFDPQGFLTRAEVAKMIYVARRGVDDGASLFKGASNTEFKDIAGHWAEGYINFAYAAGFVSGDGKGNFRPNSSITGYELLKIALTALGYDAEKEGFVGSMWQARVAAAALEAGLTEGYDGIPTTPITRDEAAGIFNNLIFADTVKYDDGILTTVTTGNPPTPVRFGERYLKLNPVTGVVTANEHADLNNANSALVAGRTRIGTAVYPISTPAELLGQRVTIYVKGTPADTTKATIYGQAIVSPLNTVVKFSAPQANLNAALTSNGLSTTVPATTYVNSYAIASAIAAVKVGETVTFIDNDGDKIADFVFVDKYNFGKVTAYTAPTASANGTLTIGNVDKVDGYVPFKAGAAATAGATLTVGFEDVAKGDYVLYRTFGNKLYVQKAESVTGTITSKASNGTTVGLSGTTYKVYEPDSNKSIDLTPAASVDLRAEGTLYLDNLGNAIAFKPVSGPVATNYAYVVETEYKEPSLATGNKPSVSAFVVLDDGTQAVYAVKSVGTATGTALEHIEDMVKNKVVKYLINDDGSISFTIESNVYDANFDLEKGKALIAGTYYANDATIFLFVDDSNVNNVKVARYVGKNNFPGFTGTSTAHNELLAYNATTKVANFVVVRSTAPATSTDSYAYITSINYEATLDGNVYQAIINGEKTTLLTRPTDILTAGGEGIYKIVRNDKGQAELGSKETPSSDTVTYYGGDVIIFGTTEYKIASTTYIYNMAQVPGNGLSAGDVVEYLESNGTVTYLFIKDDN